MVILIAGATHTGKTVLAQRLLERYSYPYLSIDHLKMGLIRSGQTALTVYEDEALTPYLWGIVREMVRTALENGQNLIVEGCYIPFDWQGDFDEGERRQIHYLCLVMSEGYIRRNFSRIRAWENRIERRKEDSPLPLEELLAENRHNRAMCERYGLAFHWIDRAYDVGELSLRGYEAGDADEMARLFCETVYTVNARDYTAEQLAAWTGGAADLTAWDRRFEASDTLVAVECGIVVGFGNMEEGGELDMLYVHKDRQGQGIGARIVRALEERARARGAARFAVYASLTARAFFERLGYRAVAKNRVVRGGVELENWRMEKDGVLGGC